MLATGRSVDWTWPAPFTGHGFRAMISSAMAVLIRPSVAVLPHGPERLAGIGRHSAQPLGGAGWSDRRSDNERHARRLAHQIERLGHTVTVERAA
jgi:hypothetical protein